MAKIHLITTRFRQAVCLLLILALLLSQSACTILPEKAQDAMSSVADSAKDATDVVSSGVVELYSKITAPEDSDEFKEILDNITPQIIAAFIAEIKSIDFNTLFGQLKRIESEIADVKAWLAEPQQIGGDVGQKHGTIAERLDVSARNATRIADGLEPDAFWIKENIAADYFIGGNAVQSKFYNTPIGTLRAVLESNDKYPYWGKDGSYYVIPKDQYVIFEQVMKSDKLALENIEYNGRRLRLSTLENIQEKGNEIVRRTGKSFDTVIKPSEYTYGEVQLNTASKTLDVLETTAKNKSINTAIIAANLKTLGKATPVGAGIDAVISCGYSIYEKTSDGRSIESFTDEDWKDVGLDSLVGAPSGAGTGAATYLFTILGMPAAFAAVIVFTIFQTSALYLKYSNDEITLDEMLMQSLEACAFSSVLAAGAIVGHMAIPVPIVGMIVGSTATMIVVMVVKEFIPIKLIEQKAQEFADEFSTRFNELIANASDIGGKTVDSSKMTLAMAYNSTASFLTDAVAYAGEKVNSR